MRLHHPDRRSTWQRISAPGIAGIVLPHLRIEAAIVRLPRVLRALARTRVLSIAVVLTLAVGIGALTLTYAIVDAAVFREPPFADASRLAVLFTVRQPVGQPSYPERWSFARSQMLAERVHSFERVATFSPSVVALNADEGVESVNAEIVSPAYFSVLRLTAERGRTLTDADNEPGSANSYVVLGHELWMRRFAGDVNLIGRTVRVNATPLTVVGVLPAGVRGLSGVAQLWIPARLAPRLTYPGYLVSNQNFISVVGRLRAEANLTSARAELAPLGVSILSALPPADSLREEHVSATAIPLNEARIDARSRTSLFVLLAAVAVLHVLACANVVSLLLGRALARRRETAVRVALGSSARALFAHSLAEDAALVGTAGLLGLWLAWLASAWVSVPLDAWSARNFYGSIGRFDAPAFDVRVALFGVALVIGTIVAVAVPPASSALRVNVAASLKEGARGSGASFSRRRLTARGAIVAFEAALAVLLVASSGLLIDSFQRMRSAKIGVTADHVLTFSVRPAEASISTREAAAFVSRVIDAIDAVPGVRGVTVDGGAPLSGTARSTLYIMGRPIPLPDDAPPILRHYVAPDHFRVLGIPLLRGRSFTASDVAGQPRVTIISESAARQFWPNQDPIGQRVWFGGGSSFDRPDSSAEIVGIVGDVLYEPWERRPNRASFYTPYAQFTYAWRVMFVRTSREPLSVFPDIRQAVRRVAPDVPLTEVQSLTELIERSWARHRFDAFLFGGFGVAALVLAATGIFAVVAYAVEQRTREIGIRMALGARASTVVGLVVRQGVTLPAVGLAAGLAATLGATRLLRASLYEVQPTDPRVLAITLTLLSLAAVVACLVPARRATRVDPMVALRSDG
jgi:putative ABC transport system permease protein